MSDWSMMDLPSDTSSSSVDVSSGYTPGEGYEIGSGLGDSSAGQGSPNYKDSSWYVNSIDTKGTGGSDPTKVDTAMFDDIWGWVKSDQGTSVLGGAANAAFKLWQMEQAAKLKESSQNHDSLEEAKMKDARIDRHNESINTPMDINMVKLQKA